MPKSNKFSFSRSDMPKSNKMTVAETNALMHTIGDRLYNVIQEYPLDTRVYNAVVGALANLTLHVLEQADEGLEYAIKQFIHCLHTGQRNMRH